MVDDKTSHYVFGEGLAKYSFENLCMENPKIKLNDRTYKYFFIARNYDKILDEKQRSFLKLVMSNESTSDFADKISRLVDDAKHNTQWRKQFMDLEIEKKYAFMEGEKKGKLEKAIEDAIILIRDFNIEPEIAAQKMDAPLEKVIELQKKLIAKG